MFETIEEMSPRGKEWKQDDIIKAFIGIHGNTYDYSKVEYKGVDEPVLIGCKRHPNHPLSNNGIVWFSQTPHHHLARHGCPICRESHMEGEVAKRLSEANIKFEQRKHFDWLPKGYHVDFYLPDYNVSIECQGEMHYFPKFGDTELQKQQTRDDIKKQICQEHEMPLYEIFYNKGINEQLQSIISILNNNNTKKGGNNGGSTPSSALTQQIRESKTRKDMKSNRIKLTESQLRNMIAKTINEAYDMDRVNRWGQRNGYEMNGNTLSNGYEDMTFTDDGEFYSSSEGFPSSDFENYMQGQPVSNDELSQYISSKFGKDYSLTQAIVEDDENQMQYIANDMSEEMDCTPEEAMKALHEFANEYHYYNPSYEEDDLNEGKVAKKKTINESQLRNMIAEAINEYYDTFDIEDNPGNVKNPKVRRLGFNASYNQPGGEKMATDSRGYEYVTSKSGKDNVRDRIMKHNGGGQPWLRGVRPNENLLQMWYNISPDNEEYCKKVGSEIVRAACYSPSLYDEIKWTLEKFIQDAQNKRLYK